MPPEKLSASILFGVRYVGLPEDFYYNTQSDVPAPAGATNAIHVATPTSSSARRSEPCLSSTWKTAGG